MAKSLRAKSKQANRRKKRQDEDSYYLAVEAARLKKVSDRLLGKEAQAEAKDEGAEEGDAEVDAEVAEAGGDIAEKDIKMEEAPKKISTSGPRGSRREQWRAAHGMEIRPGIKGQNKQLKHVARRKAGMPKRRR